MRTIFYSLSRWWRLVHYTRRVDAMLHALLLYVWPHQCQLTTFWRRSTSANGTHLTLCCHCRCRHACICVCFLHNFKIFDDCLELFKNSLTSSKNYQTASCSIRINTQCKRWCSKNTKIKNFQTISILSCSTITNNYNNMNLYLTATCILLLSAGAFADPIKDNNVVTPASGFNKCLEADSISCLQLTVRSV